MGTGLSLYYSMNQNQSCQNGLHKNLILRYKALLVLVDGPPARSEIYTLANNQGAQAAPHTHTGGPCFLGDRKWLQHLRAGVSDLVSPLAEALEADGL